jgi:hypothetical protein
MEKRFIVRADEMLTAFPELESTIRGAGRGSGSQLSVGGWGA